MEKLLKESFGLDVRVSPISPPGNLPLYLVAGREFFFAVLPLYDQVDVYRRAFDMPIAFSFSSINKRQRNTLVSKHIPFIAPPSQIYLPFLALSLSDHFPAPKNVSTDKMTASSQMLFLYFLYMAKDQAVIKIQAANLFLWGIFLPFADSMQSSVSPSISGSSYPDSAYNRLPFTESVCLVLTADASSLY